MTAAPWLKAGVLVLVLLVGPGSVAADILSNLVGWWRFDENTGTSGRDDGLYHHGATLNGGATWTTSGVVGAAALHLDGTNDYAQATNANMGFEGKTTLSLALRVKVTTIGAEQYLVTKHLAGGGYDTVGAVITPSGGVRVWVSNYLPFTARPQWVTPAVSAGTWHCVVASWQRVAGTSADMSIWIDGTLQTTTFTANSYDSAFFLSEWPEVVLFGAQAETYTAPFGGDIDDVRVYSRALTASDATQYCAFTSPTPTCP